MSTFLPGDKVIKRTEKDPANWGTVMDIPDVQQKPGYMAVMFQRHVWIKPENLMHLSEWKSARGQVVKTGKSLKDYWTDKGGKA